MELTVISAVVAFLLLFILAIQIQISGLSIKIQESIKKVDRLLVAHKKHEEAIIEPCMMRRDN